MAETNKENKLFQPEQFEIKDFEEYIEFIRKIINRFGLKQGDERLVFSVRDNNLNFIIGQRYCWNLYVTNSKGKFGVISKDKLNKASEKFEGSEPVPYYTHFTDINSVNSNIKSIDDALEEELKRSKKSSFRKFNNTDFENHVFSHTPNLKRKNMNYKEEYVQWLNKINPNDSGTKSSYIRAIEILSTMVKYDIFDEDKLTTIESLYEDLIKEQKVEGGKYYHKEAPSYGNKGFYSAAIKTYSDFLKQYKKTNTMTFMEPLNTILFGPPGTGKTYNSINKAISILDSAFDLTQDRKLIKEKYDRLEKQGQILFTTFHQSMSYEDFIEGIKPDEPKPNQALSYSIQAGIFKKACANAGYLSYREYLKSQKQTQAYSFDDLYDAFITSIQSLLDNNKAPIYKTFRGRDVEVKEINSNDSIIARAKDSIAKSSAPLTKENLQKLYDKFKSIDDIKDLTQVKETVEITPRITEFYAVFGGLKEFEKTFKPNSNALIESSEVGTIHSDENQKKYDAGVYYNAIKEFGKNAEPVVLVIDEINRGNVSQIFGELITLIEDDKRLGKAEELEIILPYSKKKFSVPPNLYIVGTMNTADRSVEALDTALRRRFVFEEIPPKYDLKELQYEFAGVKACDILKTINKRIEKLLDKDHLIGHSYFILKDGEKPNEKLKNSFYKSILPLLQEYFFGDFGKIGLVLGQGFVNLKNWDDKVDSFAEFDHESSGDFESKDVYEIIDYREPTNYEVNKVKMDFEKAIKRLMKLNIA
jgi:5-methylcytosine-specific restriction endonuclease McrBC GTP-binding regulatory subunit McrB